MPTDEESAKAVFTPSPPVLPEDAPLVSYARADDEALSHTPGVPVLRNNPFGDSLGSGDMPFFTHDAASAQGGGDDGHEGIPTGLPAVLGRLQEVELDEAAREAFLATQPRNLRFEEAPSVAGDDTLIHKVPELPDSAEVGPDTVVTRAPQLPTLPPGGSPTADVAPVPTTTAVPVWMLAAGTILGFVAGWAAGMFLMPLLG